jgi:hypothetical protein
VQPFEQLASAYFIYLALISWVGRYPAARRLQLTVGGLAAALFVLAVARRGSAEVRGWVPCLYLLMGYFLAERLFIRPSLSLEQWLLDWDRRLLGDPLRIASRWPAALVAIVELHYINTFALIPAGYGVLVALDRHDAGNHYWTMVVAAEFMAFGALAFVQTRPPWLLEPPPDLPDSPVRRVGLGVVKAMTNRVNTFPSGHTAGSLAIFFALLPVTWIALVFLWAALAIAVACVICRYHYTLDVVAGVVLAIVVWTVVSALRI